MRNRAILLLALTTACQSSAQTRDTQTEAEPPSEQAAPTPEPAVESTPSVSPLAQLNLDEQAVAAAQLPESELDRAVTIIPNPSPDPLSAGPLPFTLRQEIIDRDRLLTGRPLSAEALHRLIRGNQLTYRALACDRTVENSDPALVAALIDALSDESMHVGAEYAAGSGLWTTRQRCHLTLTRLTGQDLGYRWNDPSATREEAIRRWRSWFREQ